MGTRKKLNSGSSKKAQQCVLYLVPAPFLLLSGLLSLVSIGHLPYSNISGGCAGEEEAH